LGVSDGLVRPMFCEALPGYRGDSAPIAIRGGASARGISNVNSIVASTVTILLCARLAVASARRVQAQTLFSAVGWRGGISLVPSILAAIRQGEP
jgi:hypothetical protein